MKSKKPKEEPKPVEQTPPKAKPEPRIDHKLSHGHEWDVANSGSKQPASSGSGNKGKENKYVENTKKES